MARSVRVGTREADYLLCVNGKAIGGVEAKKIGARLTGVEPKSAGYAAGLPKEVRCYGDPPSWGES